MHIVDKVADVYHQVRLALGPRTGVVDDYRTGNRPAREDLGVSIRTEPSLPVDIGVLTFPVGADGYRLTVRDGDSIESCTISDHARAVLMQHLDDQVNQHGEVISIPDARTLESS